MKVSKKNKKCFNYLKFGVPLVLGGLILFGLFFQYSKIKNIPNTSKENAFKEKKIDIKENFAQARDFSSPDLSIGIIADAH